MPDRAGSGSFSNLDIKGIKPPQKLSDFKLIAFDMDSTLIAMACVDEIADLALPRTLK